MIIEEVVNSGNVDLSGIPSNAAFAFGLVMLVGLMIGKASSVSKND